MRFSARFPTAIFLLAVLLLSASCRAPEKIVSTPLPLSVALMPIGLSEGRRSTPEDAKRLDLTVGIDRERIKRRLVEVLEERCFTDVALVLSEASDHPERESDLVLECRVEYSPEIHTRGGSFFYVNVGMHMIGGPFCYFVKDRTYVSPAEIVLHVHDAGKLRGEEATLADRQARLFSASSRFEGVDLSFSERNEKIGNYVLSLLVPVGFMAHETEKARRNVEAEVVEALVGGIADEIERKREEILLPDTLSARFYLDPDSIDVQRVGDRLLLRGSVLHQPGPRGETLDRFEVRCGEWFGEFSFGEALLDEEIGSRDRPFFRSELSADLDGSSLGQDESLRVKIWDSEDNQRGFTVRDPTAHRDDQEVEGSHDLGHESNSNRGERTRGQ